jgi:hypothetical protein
MFSLAGTLPSIVVSRKTTPAGLVHDTILAAGVSTCAPVN